MRQRRAQRLPGRLTPGFMPRPTTGGSGLASAAGAAGASAAGSAAGAFGGWLRHHTGQTIASIRQGVEMGCPSLLSVDTSDGIVVSGQVHIIGEGTLTLPG